MPATNTSDRRGVHEVISYVVACDRHCGKDRKSTILTSVKPAGHLPHASHVPAALRIVVEEILGGATEITTAKTGGTSAASKGFP
jgi:hypothetical protein